MKYEEFLDNIKRLADMAREKEKQFNLCDHNFENQGFSEITYPKERRDSLPVNDDIFKGFLCTLCGIRLSYREGKEYIDKQQLKELKDLKD